MAIDCNVVAILDVTIYNYTTLLSSNVSSQGLTVIIKLNGRVSIR